LDEAAVGAGGVAANLIHVLVSGPARQWIRNWAEVIRAMAPIQIEPYGGGGERAADTSVGRALAGLAPNELRELHAALNGDSEATSARGVAHVQWSDGGAALDFDCIISPFNPLNLIWAVEWHPSDSATWRRLAEL
jgi:hypothetical protein